MLVAATDPRSEFLRNALAIASGRRVEMVVGAPADIRPDPGPRSRRG
ncbi:MAG: hypothetical protein U5L11_00495 [Arhodomonas sp.]|nr:hypothetical protein [Arhodomonas sp.]